MQNIDVKMCSLNVGFQIFRKAFKVMINIIIIIKSFLEREREGEKIIFIGA